MELAAAFVPKSSTPQAPAAIVNDTSAHDEVRGDDQVWSAL